MRADFSLAWFCLTFVSYGCATTIGEHTSTGFCYDDKEECGPEKWPGICTSGKRQSPVDLPAFGLPSGIITLDTTSYKGNVFRLQNNGHSIAFDFAGEGPSTKVFTFEDPLNYGVRRQYKFASGHFHWGISDLAQGSEHCIGGSCAAMELHLVHYLAKYSSLGAAVASGDESALTVVAVLVRMSASKTAAGGLMNFVTGRNVDAGTGSVKHLIDSIRLVATPKIDGGEWTTVNKSLNFTPWLEDSYMNNAYTYKGSLTTPGCNEQVNWIVGKGKATTSHQDLEALRTTLKDGEGAILKKNNRPLQPLNGRKINLAIVADN